MRQTFQSPFVFRISAALAVLMVFCVVASSTLMAAPGAPVFPKPGPRFRNDRIIIKLKSARLNAAELLGHKRGKRGHQPLKKLLEGDSTLELVAVGPGETVAEAIASYKASGLVEFAEPDYKIKATALPNDPHFDNGLLWGLNNYGQNQGRSGADIKAVQAWDTLHDASDVVVAVIDSGIRYTHEDLAENMWVNPGELPGNGIDDDDNGFVDDIHGINAVDDSGDPRDELGHGTHVAGIIGAVGNNGKGTTGVAWKVKLMACKFLDSKGDGDASDAVQAIDYARKHGARIMNASWGGADYSEAIETAIRDARNEGIIFVTASGNSATDNDLVPMYPANFDLDNIVVVCATSRKDEFDSSYSSYGKVTVDLAAPGSAIYSTWFNSDRGYTYSTGTSMAAPLVAGAFALLKARFPDENEFELIQRIHASVDQLPALEDKCLTGGRLNLEKALGPSLMAHFTSSAMGGAVPVTVEFNDASFGNIVNWAWDFGDGSAPVAGRNPSHTYTAAGNYNVRLTVTTEEGEISQKEGTILVVDNYSTHTIDFFWIEPEGQNNVVLTDDGVSEALEIPFVFEYYGVPQAQLFVGANGIIGFAPDALHENVNVDLPSSSSPNGFMAPLWQDLNPEEAGSISVDYLGEAPHRKLAVTWSSIPSKTGGHPVSFQAVLEETTGTIRFNYQQIAVDDVGNAGAGATIGLEHSSGLVAAKFAHMADSIVVTNGTSVEFRPKANILFTVEALESLSFEQEAGSSTEPAAKYVLMKNNGNVAVPWKTETGADWLMPEPSEGLLPAGDTISLKIGIAPHAASFPVTNLWTFLIIANELDGSPTLETVATLNVKGAPQMLVETPGEWVVSGDYGGPFEPASMTYNVQNSGTAMLKWKLDYDSLFFAPSQTGGELMPGENMVVTVQLSDAVKAVHSGSYSEPLIFHNESNGAGDQTFEVALTIVGNLHISSVALNEEQSFVFQVNGEQGAEYLVETSGDLAAWTLMERVTAGPDNAIRITKPNDLTEEKWFFRVRAALEESR
ncbi:MAG: S8 family serine peptidase [Verrucomicrobiales bacterium]